MQEKYKLDLVNLSWDFIQGYPELKEGKPICDEFIDGILYSEDIGIGITHQELTSQMKKVFIDKGLVLTKCD